MRRYVACESVTVPAGTFDCFRVDVKTESSNRSYEPINSWSRWVCAAVKGIAKQRHATYITSPAFGGERTTIDMMEFAKFTVGA